MITISQNVLCHQFLTIKCFFYFLFTVWFIVIFNTICKTSHVTYNLGHVFLFIMTEPLEDPYLMDEEDPAQCCALESSLWEIKVCTVCDGE